MTRLIGSNAAQHNSSAYFVKTGQSGLWFPQNAEVLYELIHGDRLMFSNDGPDWCFFTPWRRDDTDAFQLLRADNNGLYILSTGLAQMIAKSTHKPLGWVYDLDPYKRLDDILMIKLIQ